VNRDLYSLTERKDGDLMVELGIASTLLCVVLGFASSKRVLHRLSDHIDGQMIGPHPCCNVPGQQRSVGKTAGARSQHGAPSPGCRC
jgi:hypothetical protein